MKRKNTFVSLGLLGLATLGSVFGLSACSKYKYEYEFTDIAYTQLPYDLRQAVIDPKKVRITFTNSVILKEFIDTYIEKFNDMDKDPLNLGFIDISNVENIDYLFAGNLNLSDENRDIECSNFKKRREYNIDFSSLDFSKVKSMVGTFACVSISNDLRKINVSQVTNMRNLFTDSVFTYTAYSNISTWNVSQVVDMSYMFARTNFNFDIGNWDVSKVANMSGMFYYAKEFNQNIGNWDVSKVTDMSWMFASSSSFNQDIGNWDVSKVTNMSGMFYFATSFNQNISQWNVANVKDWSDIFFDWTENINNENKPPKFR
ncbi:BspA family leucine-rich repeat surface protein [Psittacicella melopsittaci]|nr:BspA family leucine-rich repeat surface protein [Psittacicella melopsittaci]